MDYRLAPAEHYDKAMELLEGAENLESGTATETYLCAAAHALLGLLKHQLDRRT